jgi:hypothetical protein
MLTANCPAQMILITLERDPWVAGVTRGGSKSEMAVLRALFGTRSSTFHYTTAASFTAIGSYPNQQCKSSHTHYLRFDRTRTRKLIGPNGCFLLFTWLEFPT